MNVNIPLSEQYAKAGDEWADLDGASTMLEESKSAVLAKMCADLGDMPVNRAEKQVKASPEWSDYIAKMVKAKVRSNKAKIRLEYLRMRFWEWQSQAATERHVSKMS